MRTTLSVWNVTSPRSWHDAALTTRTKTVQAVTTASWALSNLLAESPEAIEHVCSIGGMSTAVALLKSSVSCHEHACQYLSPPQTLGVAQLGRVEASIRAAGKPGVLKAARVTGSVSLEGIGGLPKVEVPSRLKYGSQVHGETFESHHKNQHRHVHAHQHSCHQLPQDRDHHYELIAASLTCRNDVTMF
ncbi:unnamed protein product [Symbiodinium sp. CCMP2592]|nr:unnamed protein product [Symbiodinium sp. CCMP2592]